MKRASKPVSKTFDTKFLKIREHVIKCCTFNSSPLVLPRAGFIPKYLEILA